MLPLLLSRLPRAVAAAAAAAADAFFAPLPSATLAPACCRALDAAYAFAFAAAASDTPAARCLFL